ncbi:ankyrin repeat-containing domain protein [Nemania sp. FL0031]|nr:ankyrin repeat-containing domain protein [Nemania sp. FL0031]
MHVELIAVSTTFQTDIQNDQALVAREQNLNLNKIIEYLEQIHQRVNRVETMLSDQQESVNFHVARRVSSCRPGCSCACHRPKKNQTPSIVDRIFGQLFISYAGVPILSAKCDNPRCLRAQQPEVQTEYWFPPGVFWSQIIRFQATYQAATGPSFQLKTLRRVPDTAEAVTFAMNGNIEGLKSLFIRGLASPVDVSDTRGYSLLRWALYSNQYKTCEFLVHAGADPDYRPKALTDNSPRNKASDIILQGGLSRETVEALSCMTSSSDWIENQDFPIVHEIVTGLRFGNLAEVLKENPHLVNSQDAMGRTPLLWAAARGDETAVVTLLAFGADPNILDIQWSGPVAYSADRNHTACTRILLEAGAATDVELPGGYKIGSPLNCAARNATDPLLIKTLLDFDAQVDACGVDGRTALIHAARTNNLEFALILLEYNAQINWTSSSGQTPLTTAVIYNSHDVLKLLLGRWQEYNSCPRLKGPHLLQVVAQYADLETILILSTTDHFKLKYDKNYCTGEFAAILNERHDADEKLTRAFAEFLAIIDEQVSQDSLMEGGLLFRPCGTPTSDHGSQGTEPDEFVDALASLDIKEEN